jgi:hypothetical protein
MFINPIKPNKTKNAKPYILIAKGMEINLQNTISKRKLSYTNSFSIDAKPSAAEKFSHNIL